MKAKSISKSNLLFATLIIIGVLILSYPLISALYYDYESSNETEDFSKEIASLAQKEIDERIEKAKAYNASLTPDESLHDFYTEDQIEEGKKTYAHMLEVKEKIGVVNIPSISQKIPIYAGTTKTILQKGVGHLENTSLPVGGENTHSVITAHRGLPSKRLFTDLPDVKIGDVFFIENIKETLAYEVHDIQVIEPTDFEALRIKDGEDYVTLLTCTPYMINSHRLIVTGHRIPYTEDLVKKNKDTPWWTKFISVYQNYLIGFALAIVLYIVYRVYQKRKKVS